MTLFPRRMRSSSPSRLKLEADGITRPWSSCPSWQNHKVLETPEVLRRSAQLAWANRWWTMLSVATQDALAASVLASASKGLVLDSSASDAPDLDILLDHHRCEG